MREDELLLQLTGANPELAAKAFGELAQLARTRLKRVLAQQWSLANKEDIVEDAIQDTLIKLWRARLSYTNLGTAAWYKWLIVTATRIMIDRTRRILREVSSEDSLTLVEERSPTTATTIAGDLIDREDVRNIYHAANCLWLGLDVQRSSDYHDAQLLAAQLFYLHGQSWERVISLISYDEASAIASREDLDRWLSDTGVLRYLIYSAIHLTGEELVWCYLCPDQKFNQYRLYDIFTESQSAERGDPLSGWSWPEVNALFWRYCCLASVKEIGERSTCGLTCDELHSLFNVKCADLQPFTNQTKRILEAFSELNPDVIDEICCKAGLWRRLAFQYRYVDELPVKDIIERAQPATKVVGYSGLTERVLQGWLSDKRLLEQLVEFTRRNQGYAHD